jgi:hypothetical protein
VQPEHVERLKARLWNELSLKQRLMQLADRAGGDVIRPFLPKPNRWARTTTNARNVLVHRFEEDEGEPLTNSAMYALAEMTSCVITLVLLRELGLNNDQLSRLWEGESLVSMDSREGSEIRAQCVRGVKSAREN